MDQLPLWIMIIIIYSVDILMLIEFNKQHNQIIKEHREAAEKYIDETNELINKLKKEEK